jgi:hypothetical protein
MACIKQVSPDDLRRVFESAVSEIHQASAHKKPRYGVPIVSRGRVLSALKPEAEKRALSDAARALAQLWNV